MTENRKQLSEITIRHARLEDCPSMGRIIVAATQDAFRGRVPTQCLAWLTPEESAANWAKNFTTDQTLDEGDYLFVAEAMPGEVIGLAMMSEIAADEYDLDFTGPYTHELLSLQVDPAWQRQGVGRRLVSRVAEMLRQAGGTHLLVRVLVGNPNIAFYERLGAVRLGSRPYTWEGYVTEEIFYGWRYAGKTEL